MQNTVMNGLRKMQSPEKVEGTATTPRQEVQDLQEEGRGYPSYMGNPGQILPRKPVTRSTTRGLQKRKTESHSTAEEEIDSMVETMMTQELGKLDKDQPMSHPEYDSEVPATSRAQRGGQPGPPTRTMTGGEEDSSDDSSSPGWSRKMKTKKRGSQGSRMSSPRHSEHPSSWGGGEARRMPRPDQDPSSRKTEDRKTQEREDRSSDEESEVMFRKQGTVRTLAGEQEQKMQRRFVANEARQVIDQVHQKKKTVQKSKSDNYIPHQEERWARATTGEARGDGETDKYSVIHGESPQLRRAQLTRDEEEESSESRCREWVSRGVTRRYSPDRYSVHSSKVTNTRKPEHQAVRTKQRRVPVQREERQTYWKAESVKTSSSESFQRSQKSWGGGSSCPTSDEEYQEQTRRRVNHYPQERKTKFCLPLPRQVEYTGATSWEAFSQQFMRMARTCDWGEEEALFRLIACLRGPALEYVTEGLPRETTQELEALMWALEGRFGGSKTLSQYLTELENRKMNNNEEAAPFAADIRRLVKKAYPHMEGTQQERMALRTFIRGLPDQATKTAVGMACPLSLTDAQAALHQYRDLQEEIVRPLRARVVQAPKPVIQKQSPENAEIKATLQELMKEVKTLKESQSKWKPWDLRLCRIYVRSNL